MACLFITGTDTNVGKTVVTRALLQLLSLYNIPIVGYKPIACGGDDSLPNEPHPADYACEDNSDVLVIQNSCPHNVQYKEINSYSFIHSSTPIFAALDAVHSIAVDKLNTDLKRLSKRYQNVLVEGTYGWLTPINKDVSFADWVKENQMPVVLVVGIKEGCVNHALLTAEAIKQKGLNLVGWVANRVNPGLRHYAELIELLSQKIDAPLLGQLPYIWHPEQKELAHFIENPEPLLHYFHK
ncbi:ATP-dependent dethiobiotin synthetase BioD 1 [Bibersteinia trehalosi USDA-ARS-USMARC-188]|uniref:ATP-dependent dethiobiotin synthetase BioD n=5 Tax=Bibersteinia trehalosi TaxID=47735 RepID=W0R7F1_BIBTR|nr:dethiobiotin synthase [Bibersteinia trehalosi]AGH38399.1 ATP-dependent dethiobiotin synthetase BioD 1 [Bibersteinia trehalosi USDA-ARS-USMARC-192]AHG81802.1 ATP-dependent dethiobiotin synthetase BioD 1 [Bibersteinia trehalosi USDA-ARS-USMARC-188]AHG84091.1 ATP-dependent dethiobiotin synthetase BioD 1 [Bibersteinia trehalosi USDA-ARS-USMARC-189]AHG86387.1 ATP-dependent dethiobiotin synthetase BioD 1 [Bibersteinia trehalosi USDA-ARS-USMARC-190]OAQ15098.1 dithiobiotin synthetase [Bibersteinia 